MGQGTQRIIAGDITDHFLYSGTTLIGKGSPVGVIDSEGLVCCGGITLLGSKKLIGKSKNGEVFKETGGFFTSYTKIGSCRSGRIYRLKTPYGGSEDEAGRYENGAVYQRTGGWGSEREIGQNDGDAAGGAALLLLYDMLVYKETYSSSFGPVYDVFFAFLSYREAPYPVKKQKNRKSTPPGSAAPQQ